MNETQLIQARQKAERAVKRMADGPLKVAAFQTILQELLRSLEPEERGVPRQRRPPVPKEQQEPETLAGRIVAIRSEGFFQEQRSLSDVREALRSRGWHYPLTSLSGAMQALVQQRELRRERVTTGKKRTWKYSNP